MFAASLCAVPLVLAPLAGRSSFELAREHAAFDARFNAPPLSRSFNEKPVNISRDPFSADRQEARAVKAFDAGAPLRDGIIGMHVVQGAPIGPQLLRAVVTGISPHALVEENGRVRIVAIGDIVAGSAVVRIDGTGIRLKNGTFVGFSGEEP